MLVKSLQLPLPPPKIYLSPNGLGFFTRA